MSAIGSVSNASIRDPYVAISQGPAKARARYARDDTEESL
jgi:hypothetical protein